MDRPTWDQYFMELTEIVATRSTCLQEQMGTVLVREKRVLTTGYNGAPAGMKHCEEVGCLREGLPPDQEAELCRGLHAIQNAIIQGAVSGVPIKGSVLYTTHAPCITCTKMLINSFVTNIISLRDYPRPLTTTDQLAVDMLEEAGIEMKVVGSD